MATVIHNAGTSATALPYPFRGMLKAGERVVVRGTVPEVITALAGVPGDLRVFEDPNGAAEAARSGDMSRTGFDDGSSSTFGYGLCRRTAAGPYALPALSGTPSDPKSIIFFNLTGLDVTVNADGTDPIETGVSASSFVVLAAQRCVTFIDDGSIWEPTVGS